MNLGILIVMLVVVMFIAPKQLGIGKYLIKILQYHSFSIVVYKEDFLVCLQLAI
jgi:hypothetical protein